MSKKFRCIPSTYKPVAERTAEDLAIDRAPSVEWQLREISQILSVASAAAAGLQIDGGDRFDARVLDTAKEGLSDLCERAAKLACELMEGLPGDVLNLNVVAVEDEGGVR